MPHWAAWSLPLTSTATPNLMHGIHAHRVSLISWSIWLSTRQRCAGWAGAVDGCSEWMGAGDVWVQWIGAHFFLAASCMAQKSAAQSVPISRPRFNSPACRSTATTRSSAFSSVSGRSLGRARCACGGVGAELGACQVRIGEEFRACQVRIGVDFGA